MIFHYFNIARRDSFTTCLVHSPNTDVFLLLIHFYLSLPQALLFHTGKGKGARKLEIGLSFEGIGPSYAQVFLAFHVFTGCDQMGSFSRKLKLFWWKIFQRADEDTLDDLGKIGKVLIATLTYNSHAEAYVL